MIIMSNENLKNRTKRFALAVIKFVESDGIRNSALRTPHSAFKR
jgi:hypothetical protein